MKQELESKQEKLDERKERILREANEEARKILADAKEYADQTMKMFHKFQKDHVDTAAIEKERQNLIQRSLHFHFLKSHDAITYMYK